jgi:NADH-ubiquinone oxidoreductase chain 4
MYTIFYVNILLYGLHLSLPKAHVEALIIESVVLPALLLKPRGYKIIQIMQITILLAPLQNEY